MTLTLLQRLILGIVTGAIISPVLVGYIVKHQTVAQIENSSHLLERLKTAAICILVVLAVVQFKYAVAVKRADTVHVAAAYNFTKAVEQARARTITSDSLALDTASATINDKMSTEHDRRHAMRVVNLVLSHALAYRDTQKAMVKLDSLLNNSWKF